MSRDEAPLVRRIKRGVQRFAERTLGLQIYSTRAHGRNDCADIRAAGLAVRTVVDVGANVGQSAAKFRAAFPDATVHCIEPVQAIHDQLRDAVRGDARVRTHRLALGSAAGEAQIHLTRNSTMHSLVHTQDSIGVESVPVDTLDQFCAREALDRVDLLKIDAEGFDLEVLRGAPSLLASGKIHFILVEAGFTPGDDRHVLFDEIRSLLHPAGYRLFGIYDQQPEWTGPRFIRYANVCFANAAALSAATAAEAS